ncbi:nuclear nucleic acid-binding protein C1D-like [Penaeus japonicus]|uniref:nuclear nucleic acid-binding protein C1D-like n=1 Tax=Penaeus japonicus TaxID=27405 RepID=UPI001C70C5BA|nr:nuclear nucleic acid-binding protein C1D-like [Penaeus japonicus]
MVMAETNGESSSQGDFPPGMAPKMLNMLKEIESIETELQPLISQPYHEVLRKLSPQEKAKVGMMEIYGINSLFWVLMRTSGEDIAAALRDDYKVEMQRLKETQERIGELEARAHMQRVDKQAAKRFVKHALGKNTKERKANDEGLSNHNPKKRKS